MIRIRHSNGYETIYAHCSSLYVVTGQKVTKGQQLGSHRQYGPHKPSPPPAFVVRLTAARSNPMQFFRCSFRRPAIGPAVFLRLEDGGVHS